VKPVLILASLAAATLLSGCSAPPQLSLAQLDAIGVRPGSRHWDATRSLHQQGYVCSVSGKKREQFDCTKTAGVFPTCVLRVGFDVNDENEIVSVTAPAPACIGTP
jgi:4-hydroxyphenylpyruvate dioxygenase-like putative hemolysin